MIRAFVCPAVPGRSFAGRARLECFWIETGNTQQPLQCVWNAVHESASSGSGQESSSQPVEYSRCA